MSTITIVLTDLPGDQGVSVQADGATPSHGQPRTRAQAVAMELLHNCWRQVSSVCYGRAASQPGECVMGCAPSPDIPATPSSPSTPTHQEQS